MQMQITWSRGTSSTRSPTPRSKKSRQCVCLNLWECHRQDLGLFPRAATHPSTTHGRTRWNFPLPFLIRLPWFIVTTPQHMVQPAVPTAVYQTMRSSSDCSWTALTAVSMPLRLSISTPPVFNTCIPRIQIMTTKPRIHTADGGG